MPRWLKVLLALVASVGVLAGLGEWGLRLIVPGVVESTVRSKLDLPKGHPVEVGLGGSALVHALRGGVGDIEVQIPDAPLADGVAATLNFRADQVPFDVATGALTNATASIFVSTEQLGPVISLLTDGVADTGSTSGGELVVGRSIDAFGFSVPIEATLQLGVDDGKVRVEPTALSAVGFDLSKEQLDMATGGLLEPLLAPHVVCVSDRLPAGITLENVRVAASGVEVRAALVSDFFSNPAQREPGVCSE